MSTSDTSSGWILLTVLLMLAKFSSKVQFNSVDYKESQPGDYDAETEISILQIFYKYLLLLEVSPEGLPRLDLRGQNMLSFLAILNAR